MAFPQTPLPIKAEIMVGSTWTDVTGDVRANSQIRITRGRSDEGQAVDTGRCQFVLDNNTGKYSPKNPTGPYFGQIGRNTPCRVSVMTGTPYLDLPGGPADYAETVDTAALDVTGDIDVRLDASWSNWLAPLDSTVTDTVEMIGKFNGTTQKSWLLGSRAGRLYFEWSADGTTSLNASSTLPPVIPGAGGRLAVRAALDVNNGAGGWTVRFYTADTLDSPWVQLGDAVSGTGVTSLFNSTAPLRIGQATNYLFRLPVGRVHAAEIRNGLWGTVVAQPYFTTQPVGTTSFADSAGRTWTINGGASITNRRTRFVGEISAWPVRWESKHDVVTQVEASGVMRRLTQGASPIRSAMYRELTNPSRTSIVAYFPMEDDAAATTFASGLNGQPSMPVPAGVSLASYSDWAASAPLPTFTFGTAKARVAPYAATNAIFTRFFAAAPAGGVSGVDRLFSFTTTGTARTWSLFINPAGSLDLRAYDADGTQLMSTGFWTYQVNGLPRHLGIELTQVGADISWQLIVFRIDESRLFALRSNVSAGTLTGNTVGAATEVRLGQDGLLNGTAIGHVAVSSSTAGFVSTTGAMVAWREETTSSRINRLGLEEGIAAYSASVSDQQMGAQGMATLMDLLREAEAADEGILCEERSFLGLRFRDHASLYNQAPALTLNYTGNDGLITPLEPTDDDQQSRNDITVQRVGGSSTRLTLDTGALSTQAPPNGIGRYPDNVTRNLASDAQTGEHAGWLLHLGTWDETRYPVVRMMLAKAPGLVEAAAAVDIGDRIRITNPPPWLPPDTIDLMVQGYSETLDQFTWNLDFTCTPAGPWDVAWAGDPGTAASPREFAWVDTDGSQLAGPLSTTDSTVSVVTTAGPLWTPNVADTPFDWRASGEVMTVTAPGNLQVTNPFVDTDLTGWSGASATLSRSTAIVNPHSRAKASIYVVPAGGVSAVSVRSDLTAVASIVPGQRYRVSAWVYSTNGWVGLYPTAQWADTAGAVLSSSGASRTVPASVWTYLEDVVTAPAGASRARIAVRSDNTPTTSDTYHVWAPRITRLSSSWLTDGFTRTSSAGWGAAESGQTWSSVGGGASTDYTLSGSYASHVLSTLNDTRRTGIAAPSADADIYCDMTASAAATGDSLYGAITARMLDASNMYMLRAEFTTGGSLLVTLRKMVAGTQTQLASTFTAPVGYTPGTFVRFRFQVAGSALRMKCWRVGDQEPAVWHIDATDTAITAANQIGTRSVRITGNTNVATVEVRYDNFEVVNPQTFTVTRSANGVIKPQSTGADVRLAYPAYTAL